MIQLEWYQAILVFLGILWIAYGAAQGPDPEVIERNERAAAAYNSAMQRFTNVVDDEDNITSVRHSVSGARKGKGNGGAASKKP